MSVRNYSVKNYAKIAPFPPSQKTFSDGRIASKRIYDFRTHTYKAQPTGGRDPYDTSDIENELPNRGGDFAIDSATTLCEGKHKEKSKQIGRLSNNVSRYANDYLRNNPVKPDKMNVKEAKIKKKNGGTDNIGTNTHRSERSEVVHYSMSGRVREKDTKVSRDKSDEKPLRPKSARPESRWGRRVEPETTCNNSVKGLRPKSARPESRMMRIEPRYEVDVTDDMPDRPKTSHARRASMVEDEMIGDSYTAFFERPKSRLGRDPDVLTVSYSDTDSLTDSSDTLSLKSDHEMEKEMMSKQTDSNLKPESRRRGRLYSDGDAGDSTSERRGTHEPPGTFGRGYSMLDLNSGIDEIDLDVDPVEYFMQDDHSSKRGRGGKTSLSKDTISYIGNTRKSHQDKTGKGYHGYHQNKQYSTADFNDRYYGNGFQNPQISISESNQRYVNQVRPRKINRNGEKLQSYSLANGDVYQTRGLARNALRYSKPEVSRDILAKYTTRDTANSFVTPRSNAPLQSGEYRRKPRKLDPLYPSNMKPF